MQYVALGRTGLKVSRLCLGTMTFGDPCDEATSFAILDRAHDAGVTFIDTADAYPLGATGSLIGETERIIGRWLSGRRHDVVLATKCFHATGPLPFQRGASRRHIFESVHASLKRLNTDFIDLLVMHSYDEDTPIEETLRALDDLARAGKIMYYGCSNYTAPQLADALAVGHAHGLDGMVSLQPRYNLVYREPERDLLPICRRMNIAVTPYNPLAGGVLAGKYVSAAEDPQAQTRFGKPGVVGRIYRDRYWNQALFDRVEAIKQLAQQWGIALPTLAVAWTLAQPAVTSTIIGATRVEQMETTLAGLALQLDAEQLRALAAITSN